MNAIKLADIFSLLYEKNEIDIIYYIVDQYKYWLLQIYIILLILIISNQILYFLIIFLISYFYYYLYNIK